MLPEKICMLPWISIETSPIGTARPCCLAKDEIVDTNGVKYDLNTHTLAEIYSSEYMQNLRKDFLAGNKPATCGRCWDEEAAGRVSKRMNSRIRLKEYYDNVDWNNLNPDQLWFIDLKLGNICNLKCRICGSWSSSPWAQEEIAYIPGINKKEHLAYTYLKQGAWPRENPQFWDNLKALLPNIKYFEFTGGEPFLIKEHFELLEYAVEHGYAKNIEIHYNTNGTVFPERADLWSHFKHVEIAFSIDNIGPRFEYERYLAKWDEVINNLAKFNNMRSNKITTQLCTTINIQNVYYLPEICDWIATQTFDHIYFNMLHDPWHMCISRMTTQAQDLVIERLTNHTFSSKFKSEILRTIKFIKNGTGSDGSVFKGKMTQTDAYRKQSLLHTHEEIAKAMGYDDVQKFDKQ
jgi:sulfatase maturation enzyme AslB (radical SAM superfamily)